MAGVGEEAAHAFLAAAHLLLAALAFGERGLHVVDHAVEGGTDLVSLAAGVGVAFGDAGQGGDLAVAQRGAGDLDGGGGDPSEGAQLAPYDDRADAARGGEADGGDHALDRDQPADHVLYVAHGEPGEHGDAVAAEGGHTVAAEARDGTGVQGAVGGDAVEGGALDGGEDFAGRRRG